MSAFIVFMVSIAGMYIFSVTFGGVMDNLYVNFVLLQPTLALPPAWDSVATTILTYWQLLWRSITVIVIAMGIWVVRVAIIDVDYTRQQ